MNKDIEKLKELLNSDDGEVCQSAANQLASIGTDEAIQPLLYELASDDLDKRNIVALALGDTKNQKYFAVLMQRIQELGPSAEIGTLVYALGSFDCSKNLFDLANLFLKGGYEVKCMATHILNEESFLLTKQELKSVKTLLEEHSYSIENFKVNFSII